MVWKHVQANSLFVGLIESTSEPDPLKTPAGERRTKGPHVVLSTVSFGCPIKTRATINALELMQS